MKVWLGCPKRFFILQSICWLCIVSFGNWAFLNSAKADSFTPLYRAVKATAMGGAYTAIADDDQAIFMNPAGLAGIQKMTVNFFHSDLEASNDVAGSIPTITSELNSPGITSVNSLIGKDVYVRAQESSTVVFPGFGFGALYDYQLATRLKNSTMPTGTIGLQNTYGAQAAFGTTLLKLRKKAGELRFGVAGKMLWRNGGYAKTTISQLMVLDNKSLMNALYTGLGVGIGADAGLQFVYHVKKKVTLYTGLAFTDIGDIAFNTAASPQRGNLTFGLGARYTGNEMTATFAYDYAHMTDYMDPRMKTHFGLELKFPVISLYGGLNQLTPTYGAGLDFGIINLMYLSYADEQGSYQGIDSERRQMVQVTLKISL